MAAMTSHAMSTLRVKPFVCVGRAQKAPRAGRAPAAVPAARASPEDERCSGGVGITKQAVAALAAASVAFAGPAIAFDLPGFSTGRDASEDSRARAEMDKAEKTGPRVQDRSSDPNSGKVDTYNSSGTQQADARYPGGREPKSGPNTFESPEAQAEKLPPTRGPGAGGKADSKFDPKEAVLKANERGPTNAFSRATAFTPFDTVALQKEVAFGIGEVGTTADQAEGKGKKLQGTTQDPNTSAEENVKKFGREAKAVLSNPAGPGQSKLAAEKISEANSEIPKALAGDKNAKPVSFNDFGGAALQRTAGLEMFAPEQLRHDVRLGDLSSISGGQAKKATVDDKSQPGRAGGIDAQKMTGESTSGAQVRGPSGGRNPEGGGAAGRAERRVERLAGDKTAVP